MSKFGYRNTKAAKLTPTLVREIRQRYSEGETQGKLAREFTISVVQIGRVVRGEVWQHLPPAEPTANEVNDAAQRSLLLQEDLRRKGVLPAEPPPGLLDGADMPDETGGAGLARLQRMGADRSADALMDELTQEKKDG